MGAIGNGMTRVERMDVAVYRIPTEQRESDGTLEWDATTLVVVELSAGGRRGLGYTYSAGAAGTLARDRLAQVVIGRDPMAIPAAWTAMRAALRNLGQVGIGAMAISAVDSAMWDLKARLLGVPLVALLGAAREEVPIYGSGGFCSYDVPRLQAQLAGWHEQGIERVKMKVGRDPAADPARVAAARRAIGDGPELFVDANGAYERWQALALAARFAEDEVSWLEEPVPSWDLEGLAHIRARAPAGMAIAAGEYGWEPIELRRMLEAGAVDVLQADATRCAGITGFLEVGALCEAHGVRLSTHCAPALHLAPACAVPAVCHVEWFYDHVRIEAMLFDGAPAPREGAIRPDASRPGCGLELKRRDAARFEV